VRAGGCRLSVFFFFNVTGGNEGANVTPDRFARYDPRTEKWTELASLLEMEEKYLCCPFKGRIYVFRKYYVFRNLRMEVME